MSDVNAVAVVSYVKHWDNDTKGMIEVPAITLDSGVAQARAWLMKDAAEDGVALAKVGDMDELFTITKVTWGVPSNWIGV